MVNAYRIASASPASGIHSYSCTDRLHARAPHTEIAVRRYGHAAAIVFSRSRSLRNAIEQALRTRGAVAARLDTLPTFAQVQDLLASGLILVVPPDHNVRSAGAECFDAPDDVTTGKAVCTILQDLEDRGVLDSRGLVFMGEGI